MQKSLLKRLEAGLYRHFLLVVPYIHCPQAQYVFPSCCIGYLCVHVNHHFLTEQQFSYQIQLCYNH